VVATRLLRQAFNAAKKRGLDMSRWRLNRLPLVLLGSGTTASHFKSGWYHDVGTDSYSVLEKKGKGPDPHTTPMHMGKPTHKQTEQCVYD